MKSAAYGADAIFSPGVPIYIMKVFNFHSMDGHAACQRAGSEKPLALKAWTAMRPRQRAGCGKRHGPDIRQDKSLCRACVRQLGKIVTIRQVQGMISVAVCDDSIIECSRIAGKIKGLLDEMGVSCLVRQFNSGENLLQAQESFDIIFLDILMDGLDGMRTAELLRRENPDTVLVFVTSSRKYVFDAYEVEAFRYLLKPLEDGQLRKVLGLAVQKTDQKEQDFLIVNKERQKKKLFLRDIYYFEIRGRLIYVHGKGEVFAFYEQIGALENSLSGRGFFRCHKSYLVNLKYVDVYNRQEITLDNGEKIILAKRRYEEFCQEFLKFMRANGGIA